MSFDSFTWVGVIATVLIIGLLIHLCPLHGGECGERNKREGRDL